MYPRTVPVEHYSLAHLLEEYDTGGKLAGVGLLGILAYATVSFAVAHFASWRQIPIALIDLGNF